MAWVLWQRQWRDVGAIDIRAMLMQYSSVHMEANVANIIEYNGVFYKSEREFCVTYNINYSTFLIRKRRGWTLTQIVADMPAPRKKGSKVTYNNNTYESIAEMCRFLEKDYSLVYRRIKSGWTIAQAVGDEQRKCVNVNGKSFPTLADAAKEYGLSYKLVQSRVDRGWLIEDALEINGKKRRGGLKVIFNGKEYSSVAHLMDDCPQYTINRTTAFNRINSLYKLGVDITDDMIDAALSAPPRSSEGGYIYSITNCINGMRYIGLTSKTVRERFLEHVACAKAGKKMKEGNLYNAMNEYGVDNFTVDEIGRYYSKHELREAEIQWISTLNTMAPNGYNISNGGQTGGGSRKPFTYNGEKFSSQKAAIKILAQRYGLNEGCVKGRIYDGISLDVPVTTGAAKPVEILGKSYVSMSEACRQNNVDPALVRTRMCNLGMTFEAAIAKEKRGLRFVIDGVEYENLKLVADAYDVSYLMLYKRMKRGWSIDDAIKIPPRKVA